MELDTKHAADAAAAAACDKPLAAEATGCFASTIAAASSQTLLAANAAAPGGKKLAATTAGSAKQQVQQQQHVAVQCNALVPERRSSGGADGQGRLSGGLVQQELPHQQQQQLEWGSQLEAAAANGCQLGRSSSLSGSQSQQQQQQHSSLQPLQETEELENVEPHFGSAAAGAVSAAGVNMQQQRRVQRSAAGAADVGRVPVPWQAGPLAEGYQVSAAHSSAVKCIQRVY
jgi:hypothetical protein